MFRITTETCKAFTFAELLILAAINVESMRPTPEGDVAPQGCRSAETHILG